MEIVLKASNLKKQYGTRGIMCNALDGIDLEVKKGEFLGIMGPSGAGKTTLLNVLSTIDVPTAGEVYYEDKSIINMKNKELSKFRRDNIGFIFQDYNLLDSMTIEDNIALPLALSKMNSDEIEKKVKSLSEFFGIEKQLKKYPYELSGGQKQRVAATRALITSPSVIFADEPTGALDSKSASELMACLSKMNEEFKTTIIMVTHDSFCASYSKRILFIKDGKIHANLDRGNSRKEFFNRIMNLLSSMGGDISELF